MSHKTHITSSVTNENRSALLCWFSILSALSSVPASLVQPFATQAFVQSRPVWQALFPIMLSPAMIFPSLSYCASCQQCWCISELCHLPWFYQRKSRCFYPHHFWELYTVQAALLCLLASNVGQMKVYVVNLAHLFWRVFLNTYQIWIPKVHNLAFQISIWQEQWPWKCAICGWVDTAPNKQTICYHSRVFCPCSSLPCGLRRRKISLRAKNRWRTSQSIILLNSQRSPKCRH